MKRLKLLALLVAIVAVLPLSANPITSMREVRDMAQKAKSMVVEQELYIEGYVISKPYGHNNDLNPQVHYASMRNNDLATVYIEAVDGSVGFKLKVKERKFAKKFTRYARVVLSLQGTILTYDEPCCVTVKGVSDTDIMRFTPCDEMDLPRKEKRIGELTDDDIYTYVTLKDCEIVFKDGAFSNVYEPYVQLTPQNKSAKPNKSMDCWATLLCDKYGSSIYSLTNTLCRWRREGDGVPKGAGNMRGIVSHASLPRYGGDVFGRYVILPVDNEDYDMDWSQKNSRYKSIAEWNWSDGKAQFNTESGRKTIITTDGVKADIGDGVLRLALDGEAVRGKDTNNPYIAANESEDSKGAKGLVNHGSLTVKTEACNWWDWKKDCGKGVEVQFSTAKLSGKRILFGFTFAAGNISAETSYGFPVYWGVEYSTDGKKWVRVEEDKPMKLRSLPWWWYNNVHGSNYVSILAGAGFTEHCVVLPKTLLGKSKVYVRVVPVAKNVATLGYDYNENGALRHNSTVKTTINFGSFVVRYN